MLPAVAREAAPASQESRNVIRKRYPETHTGGNDTNSFSCHSLKSMRCLLKELTVSCCHPPSSIKQKSRHCAGCSAHHSAVPGHHRAEQGPPASLASRAGSTAASSAQDHSLEVRVRQTPTTPTLHLETQLQPPILPCANRPLLFPKRCCSGDVPGLSAMAEKDKCCPEQLSNR